MLVSVGATSLTSSKISEVARMSPPSLVECGLCDGDDDDDDDDDDSVGAVTEVTDGAVNVLTDGDWAYAPLARAATKPTAFMFVYMVERVGLV